MANKSLHDDRSRNGMRTGAATSNGKTACVDVGRVFDSCSDRDCAEDLRVYFTECDQQLIDNASGVRAKKAKVLGTNIDVEELAFQDGCYSCKLTFFIEVQLEVYNGCNGPCELVRGCTVIEKKVVLYGGEGSVQVFSSEFYPECNDHREMRSSNMPRCSVQVAEPVVLDAHLADACGCHCMSCACGCGSIPETICARLGGQLSEQSDGKVVIVTIGLFTIVQMVRRAQLLIPVYDYCVPCKDCSCDEETPCDLFRRMSFPMDEFFPPMNKNGNK